jgi:hypothetical protein
LGHRVKKRDAAALAALIGAVKFTQWYPHRGAAVAGT